MAEILRPELCIVGAGALGIDLALHAARLGASVILVDRGSAEIGDGPQRAAHIAALAASARAAAAMRVADRVGLANGVPKVSMRAVQERAREVVLDCAPLTSHDRLSALGVDVLTGETHFADANCLVVGDSQIRPQAFVLAVGAKAVVPVIPGLEEAGYFTPDDILDNPRKLTHLLVIGGRAEGLVMAQTLARLGSEVTLVPQGPAFSGFDPEAADILARALQRDGVRLVEGGNVRALQPRSQGIGAAVTLPDGSDLSLDLSHVLVSNGVQADVGGLAPDTARLRAVRGQAGRYAVGALGQTSNRRIRVVGAAAGLEHWHDAVAHGRSVVEALVLGTPRRRPTAPLRVVPTEPALAQIGRLPSDMGKLGTNHQILRGNLAENALVRANAEDGGLIKVLVNGKGQVTAASLVGRDAAALAGMLCLAMEQGLSLASIANLPLAQPSLMAAFVDLAGNHQAGRAVSAWTRWRGALMRRLGM